MVARRAELTGFDTRLLDAARKKGGSRETAAP
jgi:hypothetical protein